MLTMLHFYKTIIQKHFTNYHTFLIQYPFVIRFSLHPAALRFCISFYHFLYFLICIIKPFYSHFISFKNLMFIIVLPESLRNGNNEKSKTKFSWHPELEWFWTFVWHYSTKNILKANAFDICSSESEKRQTNRPL